ncbi:T9SS type A sorting domain-containing protein [Flavobacterium sp. LAR06]|uniref:T9SS type A sorting domain-containing protein n=1 Tax=Flavobacterium sp. LAR06 TaxID=3064897 RepID=UPI0035C2182D
MKKPLLFLFLFLQSVILFAQNTTEITQTFGTYPGFNNDITVVKQQPDGKILVGGRFTCYQGTIQNRLIRLNTDGSKDSSFDIGVGFDYDVENILLQPDGKILVCGLYSKYQGDAQQGVIRLNTDGSRDTSFKIGTGADTVYCLALQPNGQILVGGGFQSFNGSGIRSVVRLNSNGDIDISFKTQISAYRYVESLIVQPDGKILAEGNFSYPQNELIRLNADGSHDTSFDIGRDGFENNNVQSMALQSDGKIIVAGTFSSYKGITENGLIRLNADGSKDISFDAKSGFNKISSNNPSHIHYGIRKIAIQSDEKIFIMGNFSSYQGISVNGLIRINKDGSRDNSFDIGTQFNNDPTKSKTLTLQSDGKLLVGWDITNNQEITQKHLTRLNTNGTKDSSLSIGTGLNFPVTSIVKQNDGKILLGGNFTSYKEVSQNNLMRLNSDKSKDNSFSIGSGFNGSVNSIALQNDGKIIVGGKFNKYQETAQNCLIRLNTDGTKDSSFNVGIGFDNTVNFITIQPDGKIIVGGNFRKYQGISQNYLIRLNTDGTKDTSFDIGSGFYNRMADAVDVVKTIVLQSDGKILVGGNFEMFRSLDQENLIRLNADGTKDTSFDIGSGFSSNIYSITLQQDEKILVGGAYSSYQGISQNSLIRLNADGSKDNSFDIGLTFQDHFVYSIVLQNDGKIIVGNYSYSSQALTQNNLVRLNTDGSKDNGFGTGITFFNNNNKNAGIYSILLQPNDELLIGGDFTAYRGNNRSAFLIGVAENYIASPLIVTQSKANAYCSGLVEGYASVSVSGGKTPYTYLWSNGATTSKITGLVAGYYSCKITDADLTTLTENFSITTIADTENPTIIAPTNMTVNTTSGCKAIGVILGNPVTADNCSVASVINNAPAIFPLGNTTVTWTVKDASNNTATATQIVTVKDATLPIIIAPTAITVSTNTNCTATNVVLGTPVTADNCSVASVTNDAPVAFPLGNTTVIWTIKDASNNIATATQIVTVKGIDATVTNNVGILTVVESGALYRWLECNNGTFTPILNENKISFTPKKTGSYAVEITKNGCTATSTCYEVKTLGTKDFDLENSLKLYPNPTTDFVTIELNTLDNAKLKILDVNGQFILLKELKTTSNTINISHLASGVYLFEISNDNGKTIKKVIKK